MKLKDDSFTKYVFLSFIFLSITLVAQTLVPEVQGLHNSFSVNIWNVSLVIENMKYAFGLRIFDENVRSESYKLGFITVKRQIDKSYFSLLAFVGQINGVMLTLGYENYSVPTTGFERNYYISSDEAMQTEYSKTWFALPAIPVGEGTIGPFALNYEGFSLQKLGGNNVNINIKRGFANIDSFQLSFLQIGNIYSLGFFAFADKSLEQGATVNLGWDFDENTIVGVLGGRVFIDVWDFRFFFSAYGTYVPSSEHVKYGVWFKFLSPLEGDLIIQNNVGYFKIRFPGI